MLYQHFDGWHGCHFQNIQPESPLEDWMWAMLDTFIVISSLWDIVMDSWPLVRLVFQGKFCKIGEPIWRVSLWWLLERPRKAIVYGMDYVCFMRARVCGMGLYQLWSPCLALAILPSIFSAHRLGIHVGLQKPSNSCLSSTGPSRLSNSQPEQPNADASSIDVDNQQDSTPKWHAGCSPWKTGQVFMDVVGILEVEVLFLYPKFDEKIWRIWTSFPNCKDTWWLGRLSCGFGVA